MLNLNFQRYFTGRWERIQYLRYLYTYSSISIFSRFIQEIPKGYWRRSFEMPPPFKHNNNMTSSLYVHTSYTTRYPHASRMMIFLPFVQKWPRIMVKTQCVCCKIVVPIRNNNVLLTKIEFHEQGVGIYRSESNLAH